MRRRDFIAAVGAAAWPLALRAQPGEMRRVGVLMSVLHDDPAGIRDVAAFPQGLADLGLVEGRNIHIELPWPGGMSSALGCSQRNWSA